MTFNGKKTGITRRGFMAGATVGLAAPAILTRTRAYAADPVIKLGHVSPRTGPLAGFAEADDYVLAGIQKALAGGIENNGKSYQVEIISKDSQSNPNRAAEVASELILGEEATSYWRPPHRTRPTRYPTRRNSTRSPASRPTVPGSPISSAAMAIPPRASTTPITSSGVWKMSSRPSSRSGRKAALLVTSAAFSPTTQTAMPGVMKFTASRRP